MVKEIKIVRFEEGNRVALGSGSFSNLILTAANLGNANKNMLGYSVFKPGIDTKQKIHTEAEELAYVVSGSGKITVGEELFPFSKGDSMFILPAYRTAYETMVSTMSSWCSFFVFRSIRRRSMRNSSA